VLLEEDDVSAKVHLHMRVAALDKSRDFYERFLGEGPVKERPGYLKFLPGWVPVNLALSEGRPGGEGAVDHVGVQVDSSETVTIHLARVRAAGLAVREEVGVNCCHANQDKFWVQDPDGVEWEVYHLNYDLEEDADPRAQDSTPSTTGVAGLPLAKTHTCCGS
jgi:catechol 2,3-dioxygenase-like lactoylglutathione lyase family enzyme